MRAGRGVAREWAGILDLPKALAPGSCASPCLPAPCVRLGPHLMWLAGLPSQRWFIPRCPVQSAVLAGRSRRVVRCPHAATPRHHPPPHLVRRRRVLLGRTDLWRRRTGPGPGDHPHHLLDGRIPQEVLTGEGVRPERSVGTPGHPSTAAAPTWSDFSCTADRVRGSPDRRVRGRARMTEPLDLRSREPRGEGSCIRLRLRWTAI